jgi:hypothetical protein
MVTFVAFISEVGQSEQFSKFKHSERGKQSKEIQLSSNFIDFGNLEFRSGSQSQIAKLSKETYLKFSLGYVTPHDPRLFDYFSTLRDITVTISGLTSGDQLVLAKDSNLDSRIQKSEVVYQKIVTSPRVAVLQVPKLSRGRYLLKIHSKNPKPSNAVKINLEPLLVPQDQAGDIPWAATDLGNSPMNKQVSDYVGQADSDDFYRFSLKNPGEIRLNLSGISSSNVLVRLYLDQNQDDIFSSDEIEYQSVISPRKKQISFGVSSVLDPSEGQGGQNWTYSSFVLPGVYMLGVTTITGESFYQFSLDTKPLNFGPVSSADKLSSLIANGFLPKRKFSVSATRVESLIDDSPFLALDKSEHTFLDIRGVGDSAYSANLQTFAPPPKYTEALDKFSKDQLYYRGDLNIINWESVVARKCSEYSGAMGFISSPEAVLQAFRAGFQVFSLANNHARDCNEAPEAGKIVPDGGGGELSTVRNMTKLSTAEGLVWAGISNTSNKSWLTVKTIEREEKKYTIAFSSIDLGRDKCVRSNCYSDRFEIAKAMAQQKADIKIVSVHSREWLDEKTQLENLTQLNKINHAMELFIGKGDVDIVFGTGSHSALPVRVIQKNQGGAGVGFWSLGNFIHPNLLKQPNNMIGRVLFDLVHRRPVQVQAIMLRSNKQHVRAFDFDSSNVLLSGLPWKEAIDSTTGLKVGYVSLKVEKSENILKLSKNSH